MGRISPERLEELRSVAVLGNGRPSRPRVREGRDADGNRFKATTDEAGHTVTDRAGDRRDVQINARTVTSKAGAGLNNKKG